MARRIQALRQLLLMILILWAVPSFAISIIDKQVAVSSDSTDVTSPTVAATGANTILVYIGYDSSSHGMATVTDSAGNTYASLNTPTFDSNNETGVWYYANASTGTFTATSLTVTISSVNFPAVAVYAISGAISGNPLDVSAVIANSGGSAATSLAYSSGVTPTQSGDLILVGLSADGTGAITTASINSSLTTFGTTIGGSNSLGISSAYLIDSTTSLVQPTWTVTPSIFMNSVMIAVKSANIAPTLTAVLPTTFNTGTVQSLILNGTNFISGSTTINLSGSGLTASAFVFDSSTRGETTLTVSSVATPSTYTISVTTPNGTSGTINLTITGQPTQPPCTVNVDPSNLTALDNYITTLATGSVICVNAGSAFWDNIQEDPSGNGPHGVKHLEIRGAGPLPSGAGSAGQTVITLGAGPPFAGTQGPDGNVVIDNFKFIIPPSNTWASPSLGIITINPLSGGFGWHIHHNDFITNPTDCGQSLTSIRNQGTGGVIDHNAFTNVPVASCSGGVQPYTTTNQEPIQYELTADFSTGADWATPSTFGTADTTGTRNLYVENNVFTDIQSNNLSSSARTVWRFNQMHNAGIFDHGEDTSPWGERHDEIYNNTWYCDDNNAMNQWMLLRSGTRMVFSNTFPALVSTTCGQPNGGGPSLNMDQYSLHVTTSAQGWPGIYPDTYPVSHQTGWGYITGATNTGSATKQGIPGGAGVNQDLEPSYIFNNNSTPQMAYVQGGYGLLSENLVTTSENFSTGTTATTLSTQYYVSSGQEVVILYADLVGGTAPAISSSPSLSWSALQGGTQGSLRMAAWHATMTSNAVLSVTVTTDSSSAARVIGLESLRSTNASNIDINPSVLTHAGSGAGSNTYTAPATGTLNQGAPNYEVVLGYFALNGPANFAASGNNGATFADALSTTSPDRESISYAPSRFDRGFIGTTGGADTSNVSIGLTYNFVASTASVAPTMTDATSDRAAIMGTVTFKNLSTPLPYLQVTDFVQANREYYNQVSDSSPCQVSSSSPFSGASGTGCGTRAQRPTTCTAGVGYWSTDQGNWNNSGSGGQGVLDKCTATNTWTNAFYIPFAYPNPLVLSPAPQLSTSSRAHFRKP